ncbi:M28 family peptidase [Pontibacter sp. G13]|uniref:M28 family peptidase n=1 Tax=Pontibacter sp. G13 TaxID=3074898 RepID=UPI00288B9360|nr:M28 family peptidase [Pontibacter sp. G13]WNJ18016.1 M28 family peptidase [Pontibacter sp. G13]
MQTFFGWRTWGLTILFGILIHIPTKGQDHIQISPDAITGHLEFLKDPLLLDKATGGSGCRLTAAYLQSQLIEAGLTGGNSESSFLTSWPLNYQQFTQGTLSIGDVSFQYFDDYVLSGGSPKDTVVGELSFLGYGIREQGYDNLKDAEIQGQILMLIGGFPNDDRELPRHHMIRVMGDRSLKLRQQGAKMVLVVIPDQAFVEMQRYAVSNQQSAGFTSQFNPTVYLGEKAANRLLATHTDLTINQVRKLLAYEDKLPDLGLSGLPVKLAQEVEPDTLRSQHVLAKIEGKQPESPVLLLAHYDGSPDGEIPDNSAAVATMLEVASELEKLSEKQSPTRPIIIGFLSGNRQGNAGAKWLKAYLEPSNAPQAVLELSWIDGVDSLNLEPEQGASYLYVTGSDRHSQEMHLMNELFNQNQVRLKLDYRYNDPDDLTGLYQKGDGYLFAESEIPTILYATQNPWAPHPESDVPTRADILKMSKIGKLVAGLAWELANTPAPLERN